MANESAVRSRRDWLAVLYLILAATGLGNRKSARDVPRPRHRSLGSDATHGFPLETSKVKETRGFAAEKIIAVSGLEDWLAGGQGRFRHRPRPAARHRGV